MTATLLTVPADAPAFPLRRGACPSVATPMATGDGLLVRLRPEAAGLSPAEWVSIAALARRYGNGLLEVTARGNLQVRGLTAETIAPFAAGLDAAGVAIRSGVAIEVPPLSGLDPAEIADATPLAGQIARMIADRKPALALAPKLAIVIDGGGSLDLSNLVADIRLDAVRYLDRVLWRISIAGDASSSTPLARLPETETAGYVLRLLDALAAKGPAARGRDLRCDDLPKDLASEPLSGPVERREPTAPVGPLSIGGKPVLGLRLPYGQIHADRLETLMQALDGLGARDVRLAPHRSLLVLGLPANKVTATLHLAGANGFWIDPANPGNAVSACAGSAGCAAARLDTHAVADALIAAAPSLFDGSLALHVSGCAKGCAHPAAAPMTLVGSDDGAGLVLDGRAGDEPETRIDMDGLHAAFARLDALARRERHEGETAHSLLTRLGRDRLAAAFQGRT
jgi:precorrin-3B synthase